MLKPTQIKMESNQHQQWTDAYSPKTQIQDRPLLLVTYYHLVVSLLISLIFYIWPPLHTRFYNELIIINFFPGSDFFFLFLSFSISFHFHSDGWICNSISVNVS